MARSVRYSGKLLAFTRFLTAFLFVSYFYVLWSSHGALLLGTDLLSESAIALAFSPPKNNAVATNTTCEETLLNLTNPKDANNSSHRNKNAFVPWHPNMTSIWSKIDLHLLRKLDPTKSPIMSSTPPNASRPVRVRVLLFKRKRHATKFRDGLTWAVSDEVLNICMDGFDLSPYFDLLDSGTIVPDYHIDPDFLLKEDQDVVWVVDMRRIVYQGAKEYSIDDQVLFLANATLRYQQEQFAFNKQKPPSLRVVFVDFRDVITSSVCSKGRLKLIDLLGKDNVHVVIRSIVKRRRWNDELNWTLPGRVGIPRYYDGDCTNIVRAPYTVRSDFARAAQRLYLQFIHTTKNMNECNSPVDTYRPVDVAHFWSIDQRESTGKLRNMVTEIVVSMNGTILAGRRILTIGNAVSRQGSTGRSTVSDRYIEGLLTTKIVVVAQRDTYEDHYRLFEAFSGGAMVLTDAMLSLPDGLVDGENIVMYNSKDHLRDLLLYYLHPNQDWKRLEIARRGFTIAMGHHRSFQLMERLFFGKTLTAS